MFPHLLTGNRKCSDHLRAQGVLLVKVMWADDLSTRVHRKSLFKLYVEILNYYYVFIAHNEHSSHCVLFPLKLAISLKAQRVVFSNHHLWWSVSITKYNEERRRADEARSKSRIRNLPLASWSRTLLQNPTLNVVPSFQWFGSASSRLQKIRNTQRSFQDRLQYKWT